MYKFKDIIEEVEERNTDLRYGLDDIVGVTIEKGLIPTVANLAQTSLEKFYIVKPETFVYNPRTHGVRLGMGFNNTTNIYITSWNNVAFRIKKEAQNIVIPYYLWLFFCRPIWDRLTNFLAWGSSTIVFAWKDFLNIDIVLPSIEYQREIVSEYETLSNRIRLNNQMIQHLEATAQALYRKTFVDNIDKENLPEGWRMGTLGEVIESYSKTHKFNKPQLVFLNTSDIYSGKILHRNYSDVDNMPGQAKKEIRNGDILFSEIRPANKRYAFVKEQRPEDFVVSTKLMVLRMKNNTYSSLKVYFYLTLPDVLNDLQKQADGASGTFPQITFDGNLKNRSIIFGDKRIETEWDNFLRIFYNSVWNMEQENEKLTELQSLLLAKMGQ